MNIVQITDVQADSRPHVHCRAVKNEMMTINFDSPVVQYQLVISIRPSRTGQTDHRL